MYKKFILLSRLIHNFVLFSFKSQVYKLNFFSNLVIILVQHFRKITLNYFKLITSDVILSFWSLFVSHSV